MKTRLCKVFNFTKQFMDYERVWKLQKYLQNECWKTRKAGLITHDNLIIVQHNPVYTLGRGATLENVKFSEQDRDLPLYRIERGGEVTFHGPGQLVAYPIFDLEYHKRDLHWFSRSLEQTVIDTLGKFGIESGRSDLNAGVWIGNRKISAQGITASRWITIHGVSFNISTDLRYYDKIIPCGLDKSVAGVCSLSSEYPDVRISIETASNTWIQSFANTFSSRIETVTEPEEYMSLLHFQDDLKLEKVTIQL